MAGGRGRRGYRKEGVNITLTGMGSAVVAGMILYLATGLSIFPALILGLLTIAPTIYFTYKGHLIRGLGASLIFTSFTGSLLYFMYSTGPGDKLISVLSDPVMPLLLALLGIATGGIASYLGAVYYWAILLRSLPQSDPLALAQGILAWGLLAYTTPLSIMIVKARGVSGVFGRGGFIIVSGALSLLIMYIAVLAS